MNSPAILRHRREVLDRPDVLRKADGLGKASDSLVYGTLRRPRVAQNQRWWPSLPRQARPGCQIRSGKSGSPRPPVARRPRRPRHARYRVRWRADGWLDGTDLDFGYRPHRQHQQWHRGALPLRLRSPGVWLTGRRAPGSVHALHPKSGGTPRREARVHACVSGSSARCVALWCAVRKASKTASLNSTKRASYTLVGVFWTVLSAIRAASGSGHP
jgi:hypothetical protein